MIAYICDGCGKEHRGHTINEQRVVPRPVAWWYRHSMTSLGTQLRLLACSEKCCDTLDRAWPSLDRNWYGLDARVRSEERERAVSINAPSLPDPPRDDDPFVADVLVPSRRDA